MFICKKCTPKNSKWLFNFGSKSTGPCEVCHCRAECIDYRGNLPKQKKQRKLQSGREVLEQDRDLKMTISSKCPSKWLFVDLETGDVWHHKEGEKEKEYPFWRIATAKEIKEMRTLKVRM